MKLILESWRDFIEKSEDVPEEPLRGYAYVAPPREEESDVNYASFVVVTEGTTVLLLLRPETELSFPGMWGLPGGGKDESDKDPRKTAWRETKEESMLDLSIDSMKFLHTEHVDPDFDVHYYKCDDYHYIGEDEELYYDGEVRISDEHDDHAWVDINDLDQYKIIPGNEKAIFKAYGIQVI